MSETPWCAVCDTRHESRGDCPGELTITGPERHGWRVLIHTGHRSEVYGVLVAPTVDGWRARILTYPNMLWSVPGRRATMKFVGATAQETERVAVDFIQQHCRERGLTVLGEPAMVDAGRLDAEALPPAGASEDAVAARRWLKVVPALYGTEKPTTAARTIDLSLAGLFITTDRPLPADTRIKILVELEGFSVPLAGTVAWCRTQAEDGRPPGMGIALSKAPPMYDRYVRALAAERDPEKPVRSSR